MKAGGVPPEAGSSGGGAAAAGPGSTARRVALGALKLAVTGGLAIWIIALVDWSRFWETLQGISLWILGPVVLLRFGGIALSAFKWQQLLAIHAARFRLALLIRWYLVGSMLNHFLPSSIGGDGYRIYQTWHNPRSHGTAVLAVFLERATGMAALGALGYLGAVILLVRTGEPVAAAVAGFGTIALAVGAIGLALTARLGLLARLRSSRVGTYVQALEAFAEDFRRDSRRTLMVAVVSFLFHLNKLLAVWLLLVALGWTADPLQIIMALFVAELAGLVPISLGGLGVLEGSFIFVMGQFGLPEEISLATMLLLRVLMIPFYLAGALFYFLGSGREQRAEPMESDRSGAGAEPAHAK